MTVIPQSVVSPPRAVSDSRSQALGSAGGARQEPPVWLISMPTVAADGVSGTQWFAVRAHTAHQAIADAAVHAASTRAVVRRRGARVFIEQARVAPWTSDGTW
ncbi:hypothetical protein [Streptomyces sp. NPDC053367]|uniref:hypothetical protein n=1 Tax=Streptomyces sp. NPDC053367 TaxID=3365700 RepID=UPI0037D2E436